MNRTACAPSGGGVHNSSRRAHPLRASTPRLGSPARVSRGQSPARRLHAPAVGQTPARKAAKAASGQQPKKRPGKAQREAIKQAQTAKKIAAKKAVPLPRGSVRATYPGTCPACLKDYGNGEVITQATEGRRHPGCPPRHLSAAEREVAPNKVRIDSGETFRSRKPSDWRRGAAVSSTRPAR